MSRNKGEKANSKKEIQTFLKDGADKQQTSAEQINFKLRIFLFLAIDVMLLVLCTLTGVFIYTEDDPDILDDKLCVQCQELKIHPDDQLHNIQVYQGDVCCAKPEHLEELVHNFSDVWYRRKLNKVNPRYRDCRASPEETPKAAIKLTKARHSVKDRDPLKIHWEKVDFNLNKNVLFYNHGKIEVKKPGLFFIYAQMEFQCDVKKRQLRKNGMYHNVVQIARLPIKGREVVIMKTSSTPPDCEENQPANYTSHVGTTLQLFGGDLIYARVFNWDTLKNHSSLNFLGMHKVE